MRKRNSKPRRGAVVVEAAVMLPLLITITILSIDLAQYINSGQELANASREAARAACRSRTETVDEVEQAVYDYLHSAMPYLETAQVKQATTISIQQLIPADEDDDDSSVQYSNISGGNLTSVPSGEPIRVLVRFDFDVVRWIRGPGYPTHEIRSVGRRD